MEKRNSQLARLLDIQNELNEMGARIENLENGKVYKSVPIQSASNDTVSFSDFLSMEDLQRINSEFSKELNKGVDCDAADYALSAASGVLCGLMDVLFVKTPHAGLIGKSVDELFDKKIIEIAKDRVQTEAAKDGKPAKEIKDIKKAIGFFESKAKVSYDQAKTQEIKKKLADGFTDTIDHLSAKNHHVKSLSHYPDLIGLISSICNQFTNTSTFLDNAKGRITIINGTGNNIELVGDSLTAKIYCGFINWLMHCLSDVAGSSGSRGNDGIGMGLPIPFTEFFQFCNFGNFPNEKKQYQTFATVMTKVYEQGYDLRHGVAASGPVLLNDLIIHAIYILKQHFYNNRDWSKLLMKQNDPILQRMRTTGVGALCLIDLSEAAITSYGNWVVFFSHLNLAAWTRLGLQGISELKTLCNREMMNIAEIQADIDKKWNRLLDQSKLILIQDGE